MQPIHSTACGFAASLLLLGISLYRCCNVHSRRACTTRIAGARTRMLPVCVACTSTASCSKETHFWAFRLPQGLNFAREQPCQPDSYLGRNDVYLPVTHVGGPRRGPTDSGGLWFYYTPGCSDLLWHIGRTILARNRAHAAVLAEQRMAQLEGKTMSDREAISRLASFIRNRYPRWGPLGRARNRLMGKNASIETILAEAARGLYGTCPADAYDSNNRLRPCSCLGNVTRTHIRSRRALALTPLAGDKVLSLHSEPILRRLPIDTVTMHQQPQGGGSPLWATEIWDLRGSPMLSRHLENASSHPEVVARSRWAIGSDDGGLGLAARSMMMACEPAAAWHTCMSCRGSKLEKHCNATVQWYDGKERGRGRRV